MYLSRRQLVEKNPQKEDLAFIIGYSFSPLNIHITAYYSLDLDHVTRSFSPLNICITLYYGLDLDYVTRSKPKFYTYILTYISTLCSTYAALFHIVFDE